MNLDPVLGLAAFVLAVQGVTALLKGFGCKALSGAVVAIGAAGIPLHELGHAVAALLFRVRVVEVDLLSGMPGGRGYSGHVTHRAAGSAAAAVAMFLGPLVAATVVLSFLGEAYATLAASGVDTLLLAGTFLLAVSVAAASTPSGADAGVLFRALRRYPGQALATVAGMLAGAWVLWLLDAPMAPWWWLLLDWLAVLGAGTACCKAYARLKPTPGTC